MTCPLVDVERGDLQHFVGCAIPDVADQQAVVPARTGAAAKSYALGVSEKIETYISSHGQCPTKLEYVGISKSTFKEHLWLGGYSCKDQRPFLF